MEISLDTLSFYNYIDTLIFLPLYLLPLISMAKAVPKTVGELYESTRSMDDITTAMTLQDAVKPLVDSGEVQKDSPLTDEIIEKIKGNCVRALASGGAATSFFAANLLAQGEARVGAVNPAEAASSFLDNLKTGIEGAPTQLLVGTIAPDRLQLISQAIQNLELDASEPLSRETLERIKKEVEKLAGKHFTGDDGEWNGRAYSDYNEGLYDHWKEIEEGLNSQEIDSLEAALSSENDPQKKVHLCQRAIALVYMEHSSFRFMSFGSTSYRQGRAKVDEQKIQAKFQKVQAAVEQAGLNFEEIADSVWKRGGGGHFFPHPDDIDWDKEVMEEEGK